MGEGERGALQEAAKCINVDLLQRKNASPQIEESAFPDAALRFYNILSKEPTTKEPVRILQWHPIVQSMNPSKVLPVKGDMTTLTL